MNIGPVSRWECVAGWLLLNDKDFAFEHACVGTDGLRERYNLPALQKRACTRMQQLGLPVEGEMGRMGEPGKEGYRGEPHPLTGVHGPRGPMGPPAFLYDGPNLPSTFDLNQYRVEPK